MATKSNLVMAIMILTVAATILTAAGLLYFSKSKLLNAGVSAPAKVVSLTDGSGDGKAPLFEFQTRDGRTVQVQSLHFSNPPQYVAGQAVEIVYDPKDPQSAAINAFGELWGFTATLGALGGVAALAGAGMLIFLK
jgi:hypothetical protein